MSSYNKILTDYDRQHLTHVDKRIQEICPDMWARKIHRSHVQSSFLLHAFLQHYAGRGVEVLGAGSYEDLVIEYLKRTGYKVTEIDPVLNTDLNTYRVNNVAKFDAVVSTSVLEHVDNDEGFLDDCIALLEPGGICFMTMDYKADWKRGEPTPPTDVRFYRRDSILRLIDFVEEVGCELLSPYDFSGKDDFQYAGFTYSFATLIFRKK